MPGSRFSRSHVLIYAAIGSGIDEPKRRRALDLIETKEFAISAQVLQEFFVTVVRKAKAPRSATEALEWIEQFAEFPCVPIDHRLVRIAIERPARYRISCWDAAILAAAEALGCETVYSEDLNGGQKCGQDGL